MVALVRPLFLLVVPASVAADVHQMSSGLDNGINVAEEPLKFDVGDGLGKGGVAGRRLSETAGGDSRGVAAAPLQLRSANFTSLYTSAGCMRCCSSNPDCSYAYMDRDLGQCCAREPATCCPSFARCAVGGCMRPNGPSSAYAPYPSQRSSGSGFGSFILFIIIMVAVCWFCGLCPGVQGATSAPAVGQMMAPGGGFMPQPGFGGGWGAPAYGPAYGGGYSGGAVAGAGGAGFLGGIATGMLLEDAMRPNYYAGPGYGGGEMYTVNQGGETFMPFDGGDGGGGGDVFTADGGGRW